MDCVRLLSTANCQVGDSKCMSQSVRRNMEDIMPQNDHDYAADLHIHAAHAHTAAAAAHHRGDHEAAGELSSRAQEYSVEAAEKTEVVVRRTPETLRA